MHDARVIKTEQFMELVGSFHGMTTLQLSGTFFIKSHATLALSGLGATLQHLTLSGFRQLQDQHICTILNSMAVIETLCLSDCTSLAKPQLVSPTLRKLDLSRCIYMSSLSLSMPSLTCLDASWCSKLPDEALSQCTGLLSLSLKGCLGLIEPRLEALSLQHLDMQLCGRMVSATIVCPMLTDLQIAMCNSLLSLSLDLPSVTELDLSKLAIEDLTLQCTKLLRLSSSPHSGFATSLR
ncbi:unnamed protein product [Chrysoparadoxa australica]